MRCMRRAFRPRARRGSSTRSEPSALLGEEVVELGPGVVAPSVLGEALALADPPVLGELGVVERPPAVDEPPRRVPLRDLRVAPDRAVGPQRAPALLVDRDQAAVEVLLRELGRRDRLPDRLRGRADVERVDLRRLQAGVAQLGHSRG